MTNGPPDHNERIRQLLTQLRQTPTNDAHHKEMNAIRNELESEFKRMHEQQGSEIAAIEKRLQSLKNIHQQRAENQDKIIQRRIDQLLGRSDPLDWNYTPPTTPSYALVSPSFSNHYGYYPDGSYSLPGRKPIADSRFPPSDNRDSINDAWRRRRNQPTTRSPQGPATDTTSNSYPRKLMDAFAVIGKTSDAAIAEQATKVRLREITELHQKGAVPQTELSKVTLEHASVKKQFAILKLQLQSIQRDLTRYLNAAELELAALNEQQKSNPSANSKSSQLERQKAESAITEAKDAIAQFEAAMKLIPASADSVDPSDAPQNPNERAEQPTPELDAPTDEPQASEEPTLNLETEDSETTP
ncbi:hypothetical protein [Rhodopirellula islandica]|nr:hypothetical protein [Rhodopirellula islandica]